MGNPLVSIVMPVYNTGPFLREAIESVLAQTRADWELIVVDDGSTDDSAAIVSSYPDPRIRLIAQQNAGQSVARNTAMKVARGAYVYFIDSDDVIEPDLLDTCLRHMGENDLLFFNADTMGDEASPWQTYRMASLFAEGQTMTGAHALEHSMQRYHWRSPVWLLFIRRAFLDEARMTFYPGIIHEDELYTGTLFARCPRCAALHRTLVRHRIRGGSTMGTRFGLRNLTCYAIACRGLMEERHPAATCLATYTINNVLLTAKKMTLADKMRGISILHSTGVLRLARTKILIKFLLSRA